MHCAIVEYACGLTKIYEQQKKVLTVVKRVTLFLRRSNNIGIHILSSFCKLSPACEIRTPKHRMKIASNITSSIMSRSMTPERRGKIPFIPLLSSSAFRLREEIDDELEVELEEEAINY
ncbi:17429_t:CDS:2, partial [Gigaspora rosea]